MGSVFFETDTEFVNVTVVNKLLEGVKFVLCYGRFLVVYTEWHKIDSSCLTMQIQLGDLHHFAYSKDNFFKRQVI
jgi:hypothetical protein